MRKLLNVMVGAVLGLAVLTGAPALAQQATCDVGFTGPDSNNICTSTMQYQCSVTNTNTVQITNDNNQVVASGQVANSGNTSGGSATSGTVMNSNGATFNVTITNGNSGGQRLATCLATRTVPATVTPDVKPSVVSKSSGDKTTTSNPVPKVAALPVTSGESDLSVLGGIAGAVAVVALISIAAVAVYRRKMLS